MQLLIKLVVIRTGTVTIHTTWLTCACASLAVQTYVTYLCDVLWLIGGVRVNSRLQIGGLRVSSRLVVYM